VGNGKSDGRGPSRRISAWLPPGLALGWLAVLATFVHSAGRLLAIWATTGFLGTLLVLLVLLVDRRTAGATGSRSETEPNSSAALDDPSADEPASPTVHQGVTTPSGPEQRIAASMVSSTTGQAERHATAEISASLNLRVLTAEEVASVLRVGEDEIIKAIGDGKLPGNQIGSDWRVDQGALTRWLQGKYKDPLSPPG
jgi:excisionase family DNA binding protein